MNSLRIKKRLIRKQLKFLSSVKLKKNLISLANGGHGLSQARLSVLYYTRSFSQYVLKNMKLFQIR